MRPRLRDPQLLTYVGATRGPHIFVITHGPDCVECSNYVRGLEPQRAAFGEWGARLTVVSGNDAPAAIVTDEWGEIFFQSTAAAQHELPAAAELDEWARFVAIQCEECEQPEGEWRSL